MTSTASPSLWRQLPAIVALAIAVALAFMVQGAFSPVQLTAQTQLGLSDAQLGLVQGLSAAVPLVLLSIPIGRLIDRGNRVRLLAILGMLWSAGEIATALAGGFTSLFVARVFASLGFAGAITAAISIGADLCTPAQRGRVMLLLTIGRAGGQAAAFGLTGALFGLFGHAAATPLGLTPWRATQAVLGIGSLLLILAILLLREPARQEADAGNDAPTRVVLRELWTRRAFLLPLFAGGIALAMADTAAGIWAPAVLGRTFGQTPDQFGGWMGALIFGTGIASAFLGGFAADAGQRSGRHGGILIGAVVAAGIGVPAALFPLMPGVTGFGILLGVFVLSGGTIGLIQSVAMSVLLPNELRGLAIGAFLALAGLIGFGVGPSLVTGIAQLLGGGGHLASALAGVCEATSLLSVALLWIAMRNAPERPVGKLLA